MDQTKYRPPTVARKRPTIRNSDPECQFLAIIDSNGPKVASTGPKHVGMRYFLTDEAIFCLYRNDGRHIAWIGNVEGVVYVSMIAGAERVSWCGPACQVTPERH